MKSKLFTAITVSLVISGTVMAEETIPLNAVNKANEVIDRAIEAYGGADTLNGITAVHRKQKFKTWATYQSKKPGPPWDEAETLNWAAVNFETEQFRGYNAGSGGGFDFEGGQLINGDGSYNFDFRGGTMTEIANPDFHTTAGPFIRVTAPLLIKQLQERRNTSHWLGEAEVNGTVHDIVTLVMEVGPALALYIDQDSGMLTRSERVLPPFGQVDYRFSDYETIDGIPFAKHFELYVNDQPNLLSERWDTQVNPDFAQFVALPAGLDVVPAVAAPTDVELQEIEEGVFLVGANGTYVMFVEMDDHVISVGGTAGVDQRIAALREVVADKPITYGVLTHHHNDHLLGVPVYEAEDATIVTVAQHEEVVRNTAADGDGLKLQLVDGKYVFNGGSRTVEVHDIGPTPHTEHLLVAYMPDEGILFEADHFPNPLTGRFPPAQPVTKRLAAAIDELGLEVRMIIGAHSPRVATREDLNRVLATKPVNVAATASW